MAAEMIGVDRRTLYRKLERWGVHNPVPIDQPGASGGT